RDGRRGPARSRRAVEDHRVDAAEADQLDRTRCSGREAVGARRNHGCRGARRASRRSAGAGARRTARRRGGDVPSAVALIPARAGSERVPQKNVRTLARHPLIAYAIATARQAGVFDRVVCSTDSSEIAEVAGRYGAEVPFLRPAEYATATSPDIEWITHTLERLDDRYDLFAIVRATNPFRGPDAFRRGLEQLLATPEADSIRAVELVKQHPGKMWVVEGRTMRPLLDQSHLDVAWHAGHSHA